MPITTNKLLFLTIFLGFSSLAQADKINLDMKSGLWETKVSFTGEGATQLQSMQMEQAKAAMEEMKKQMANMKPEQRKQMEAIMAQSDMTVDDKGIGLNNNQVQISNKGTIAKSCITQAQIERGDFAQDDEGCSTNIKQLSPKHLKSTQVCKGESGTSEMDVIFDSPKHYTGKGSMKQSVGGEVQTMELVLEGTWLGSDCGSVQPEE
jgi:hypothetical protein